MIYHMNRSVRSRANSFWNWYMCCSNGKWHKRHEGAKNTGSEGTLNIRDKKKERQLQKSSLCADSQLVLLYPNSLISSLKWNPKPLYGIIIGNISTLFISSMINIIWLKFTEEPSGRMVLLMNIKMLHSRSFRALRSLVSVGDFAP